MKRALTILLTSLVAIATLCGNPALGQMMPGGPGGPGGMNGRPGMNTPGDELPSSPAPDKPDAAAQKAFKAGMKSMAKAQEYASAAAAAANADKKAKELEKMGDAYDRALDQFTEALSNKGDMVEAWNNVGYIHLKLGAFAESVDDYNHTLALQPDLPAATLHRAEALLAVDRIDDAKSAYMDLFNHERPLADELMAAMQQWITDHRANLNGMPQKDVDAFDKWVQEREGIAKQTASLPQ
jgi:tetratricopeptide (TPR) repeat protein